MTIGCGKWLKTAIDGGNLWSTAPQPKDDDDNDDDDDVCCIFVHPDLDSVPLFVGVWGRSI